jgi:hypothetical protein
VLLLLLLLQQTSNDHLLLLLVEAADRFLDDSPVAVVPISSRTSS